jgi:sulfite oxidase
MTSVRRAGVVQNGSDAAARLREEFAAVEVTATLQCAGNRRADMAAVRDTPGEEPWGPGATGTAVRRGVRLNDVIAAAGVRAGARHVAFVGADRSQEAKPVQRFAGSVPLEKARRPEDPARFGKPVGSREHVE